MVKTRDFFVLPFNAARIRDKYLVSNIFGSWDFLSPDEFKLFSSLCFSREDPFFSRIISKGLVADEANIQHLLQEFRVKNSNLFLDARLHIAVVTTRCNQACSYCQAKTASAEEMTPKVARRVLETLFSRKSRGVTLEFQGGEPLLNWPCVKFMVSLARQLNRNGGKRLRISIVTNLCLLDDEKARFLVDNDVDICTSFDGPQSIHDKNRKTIQGEGTYRDVVQRIKRLKNEFGKTVGLLPTITKYSLKDPKAIIDEYVALGAMEIHLRPVSHVGSAAASWKKLGYSAEDFCDFYVKAMEYILLLNKSGVAFSERMTRLMLTKVLAKRDIGYVDFISPCGAGRSVVTYMPDGSCYPCDEARMAGKDILKLGNVLTEEYEDMIKKDSLLHLLEASCSGLWNYGSVFSPWLGVCPVMNYATQENFVMKTACSMQNKINIFQYNYIFERILEGGQTLGIFNRWVGGERYEKEN